MTKYYWAMAVIAAFVVGTIATATPVFAPPPEDDGEGGWKAAVADLKEQIDNLDFDDADSDPTNELGPVLGFYDVVYGGVFPVGETSQKFVAECDSGDEVVGMSGGEYIQNIFFGPTDVVLTSTAKDFDGPGTMSIFYETIDEVPMPDGILSYGGKITCADFAPAHVDP